MASRILLADDSITIQKVVNLTFADEGIEVVSVSNGEVAERRLSEVNPDLVLADIFMPGKNGYELCEFIKQSAQFRNVPVVLLVGAFEPFDQIEARRVRADAHLTKPFESRTLVETVRKLITVSNQGRSAPLPSLNPPEEEKNTGRLDKDRESREDTRAATDAPTVATTSRLDIPDTTEQAQASPALAPQQPDLSARTGNRAINENAPLDLDFAAPSETATASSFDTLELEPDWQAQGAEFFGSTSQPGDATDSSPILEIGPPFEEPIELTGPGFDSADSAGAQFSVSFDEPADQTATANTGDTRQAEAWLDSRAQDSSTPGDSAQNVLMDFEKVDAPLPPQPDSLDSFDLELPSFDAEQAVELSEIDSDEFDTQPLGSPFNGGERSQPYGSAQQSSGYNAQVNQSGYIAAFDNPSGMAEARLSSSSSPSMLAVDEPLGDLLVDELPAVNYSAEAWGAREAESLPAPTDSMSFEALPQEPAAAPDGSWNQDYQLSVEAELTAQNILDLEPATSSDSRSLEQESHVENLDAAGVTGETPAPSQTAYEPGPTFDILMPEPEAQPQTDERNEWERANAETAPGADSVSQTPPDYTDADQAEQYSNASALDSSVMADANFTSSAMWSEEETRFAAIDIEAVPVGSSDAAPGSPAEAPVELMSVELADLSATQPIDSQPLPSNQQQLNSQAQATADAQPSSATLTPDVMDEIVRRVVSQISESVVREIAWEVVPDCVERVIEKLARESLPKKL